VLAQRLQRLARGLEPLLAPERLEVQTQAAVAALERLYATD
jgi:hypothetical protein